MPGTLPHARTSVLLPEQSHRRSAGGRLRHGGVVVGADGSYLGDRAVAWAARHASLLGDELHVYQSTGAHAGAVAHGVDVAVREYPEMAVVRHFIDVPDPFDTLLEASADARLIVLGARGRHHPGLGIGHLVRPLAAAAHCAVAVIKGHPDAIRGLHTTLSVAVGSRDDLAPVHCAAELAAGTGKGLRIVHAGPGGSHDSVDWVVELVGKLAPEVKVEVDARACLPHEIVAAVGDTDLLVIGAGSTRGQAGIGRVTNEALFHAPCPVVVA